MGSCAEKLMEMVNSGQISPNTTVGELLNANLQAPQAPMMPVNGLSNGLGSVPERLR